MYKWKQKAGESGVRMMPSEESPDLSSLALKMKGSHQPETVCSLWKPEGKETGSPIEPPRRNAALPTPDHRPARVTSGNCDLQNCKVVSLYCFKHQVRSYLLQM